MSTAAMAPARWPGTRNDRLPQRRLGSSAVAHLSNRALSLQPPIADARPPPPCARARSRHFRFLAHLAAAIFRRVRRRPHVTNSEGLRLSVVNTTGPDPVLLLGAPICVKLWRPPAPALQRYAPWTLAMLQASYGAHRPLQHPAAQRGSTGHAAEDVSLGFRV